MEQPDIAAQSTSEKLEFLDHVQNTESHFQCKEELAALSQDEDAEVRERAVSALWHIIDPAHIDFLTELAAHDPVIQVRTAALSDLGAYVYEGFVNEELNEEDFDRVRMFLLDLYRNAAEPLDVRRAAVEALGFITSEEIETVVREAYEHSECSMRVSAIFAMGRSGTRTWDDILLKEMQSPDSQIRFEAARAAGESYMSRSAEMLERLSRDPERDVQLAAIKALGKAGRPNSRQLLRSLMKSSDEDIRDAASEALDELDLFESDTIDE